MLALIIIFYETRSDNHKKAIRVLSFVIYSIIKNYVCIDYLDFHSKQLSETTVGFKGGSQHGDKHFDRILGIGIPDLLMSLLYCHGFLKNIDYVFILKCPKRMLEYNFQKGLSIL